MYQFKFWNSWTTEHKTVFRLFASIFGLVLLYFLYTLYLGAGAIIDWQSLVQSETVESVVDQVNRSPFNLPVAVDSIIFFEYFGGSGIIANETAYYIFLAIVALGISYLLALSTYLSRFWYMVSTGLFIVMLIFLKLELLLFFNSSSKSGLIITFILFLPLSYYFQAFNKNSTLISRFISFIIATLIFGAIIKLSSGVPLPFMQLAIYSMPILLIITLVFILLVAQDIIASFLRLVSSGKTSVGNWKHFYFISGVYLVNVLLLYLNATDIVSWNIIPINAFIILLCSALVGIWGYKQKESQYEYLFPFNPLGAIFYMTMAILAFSTIAFLNATGNDPVLRVISDVIIYSHLAYGFIFLMYISANFLAPLTKGLAVYRVLYKPDVMPYFTYRFAGIIAFGALLFMENWELSLEKSFAGYYNGLGDLHAVQGENLIANSYYKQGSEFAYSGHRSNYSLATNAENNGDITKAIQHYKRSNLRWPTEYSYANLSNIYFAQDRYFDAMFTLKEGLEKFPESGPLMNNLGVLYSKIDFYDSSLLYLEGSLGKRTSRRSARNNLLALFAKSRAKIDLDQGDWKTDDMEPINMNNYLAVLNSQMKSYNQELGISSKDVDQFNHSAVYNYLINGLWREDSVINDFVNEFYGQNLFFDRRLDLGLALNKYYRGDVASSIDVLKGIRGGDRLWTGKIDHLLGLWYLQNDDLISAKEMFQSARDNYHSEGQVNLAIVSTLSGDIEKSIQDWDSVMRMKDASAKIMAEGIISILEEEDLTKIMEWEDSPKYQWILFHKAWNIVDLVESFKDANYKVKSTLDKATFAYKHGQIQLTETYIQESKDVKISSPELVRELNSLQLKLYARTRNYKGLASILDTEYVEENPASNDLYKALLSFNRGEIEVARKLFSKWIDKNPFDENMAILASEFYEANDEIEQAYLILQRASSANIHSLPLQMAYVGICGRMGNEAFGRYVLENLKESMEEEEWQGLNQQFQMDIEAWFKTDF